jgi:hypothetical protein
VKLYPVVILMRDGETLVGVGTSWRHAENILAQQVQDTAATTRQIDRLTYQIYEIESDLWYRAMPFLPGERLGHEETRNDPRIRTYNHGGKRKHEGGPG